MNRRDFLAALPAVPALANAADTPVARMPADPPRALPPTGADLGTLFPDVEKLVAANHYALTFPGGQFATYDQYRAAARDKVLDLLLYRPERVEPRPEVLERVDRGDHIREKVVLFTSPVVREP